MLSDGHSTARFSKMKNQKQIITALQRGAHISAKDPAALHYLHKETQEKLKGGYINIIKWNVFRIF